ncbi:MAG: tRNA (adenosine(37)-N6)-threonylcarbamoyltransferase complex ATPase subunit type 1 TsaE [Arenimonas sp.]
MTNTPCLVVDLPIAASTDALGRSLARVLPADCVVHLRGELGAGKSSLARALLRALGVSGSIKSPTYSLVERYPLADGHEAVHLDLYRIRDPGELDFLGLDDLGGREVLWLIEWPERGGAGLPPPDLEIRLDPASKGRRATLRPLGPVGVALWPNLNKILAAEHSA